MENPSLRTAIIDLLNWMDLGVTLDPHVVSDECVVEQVRAAFSSLKNEQRSTEKKLGQRMSDADAEIAKLRRALIDVANALENGSSVNNENSTEFLLEIPKEVRLYVSQLRKERDDLAAIVNLMKIPEPTTTFVSAVTGSYIITNHVRDPEVQRDEFSFDPAGYPAHPQPKFSPVRVSPRDMVVDGTRGRF